MLLSHHYGRGESRAPYLTGTGSEIRDGNKPAAEKAGKFHKDKRNDKGFYFTFFFNYKNPNFLKNNLSDFYLELKH
jgi:hypothetical protein